MSTNIGREGERVAVDDSAYSTALASLVTWIDANRRASTATVKARVDSEISALAPGRDAHWQMIAVTNESLGTLTNQHIAFLVHHFWPDVPVPIRRAWTPEGDGRPRSDIDFDRSR